MTRRNLILLVIIVVIAIGAGDFVFFKQRQHTTIDPVTYKAGFVDNCLKQANAAAMQQGNAFNEEQKRVLQQVCGCGADRTLEKFTPADVAAFQANPSDPSMLSRIKDIMQSCAAEAKMPAANP